YGGNSVHPSSLSTGEKGAQIHGMTGQERRKADPQMAIADFARSTRESFLVGWKIESNWTDPVLFATYRLVQPLASLLIVAFIVIIGGSLGGGGLQKAYLARLIVSNSFFV